MKAAFSSGAFLSDPMSCSGQSGWIHHERLKTLSPLHLVQLYQTVYTILAIVTTGGVPEGMQSVGKNILSRAPQVVGEGFDVGDRIEVLSDEKVEVRDVSPRNINDIIRFDHDVRAQVSHIKNSF
jgi:hypothetical protein